MPLCLTYVLFGGNSANGVADELGLVVFDGRKAEKGGRYRPVVVDVVDNFEFSKLV